MISTKVSEREKEIVQLLATDSSISVSQMSDRLGVSAVTIRSDLNNLSRKGIVMRTHGGASPAFHPNVVVRHNLMSDEKEHIAQAAAGMVQDGDTIMIEAGTTTALIVKHLLGKRFINIVTNSTLIIPFARVNPGINLTVVGGSFRPATESLVGPMALAELEQFHVRLAFVGTDGFTLSNGLSTHLVEGAEIVRKMAERSEQTILVADSSKYDKRGFVRVLPLSEVDILITDWKMDQAFCREIEETGMKVITVE